jgi:hypothetical protein
MMLRRFGTLAFLVLAIIACATAPCAAFMTPTRSVAAAYAFDVYTPAFDDLSALRLDFFNWMLPQMLTPANDPFCVIPSGCRTGVMSYDFDAKVNAFTVWFGKGVKAVRSDAMQRGTVHAGALIGIPIFDETAKVVPAIRIGRAVWLRAGNVAGPPIPAISVEASAIPASTDANSLSYAIVFVASSFTSATEEDMTAWYLIPYVGSRRPNVALVNYGTQPVYVVASGIQDASTTPLRPGNPFSPDNLRALNSLTNDATPAGAGSSTFKPLSPVPPQIVAPSSKANAMIWSVR